MSASATETYKSLTDEQRQILADKKIDLAKSADELIALLAPVAACDAQFASMKTKAGCASAGFGVAAFISIFFFFPFGLIVTALLAGGLIYFVRQYRFAARTDISDNLGGFAVPLLRIFREDFHPGEPVHLTLDLTDPVAQEKKTSEEQLPKTKGMGTTVERNFEDAWMQCEATLADGSRVRWTVTDYIRQRTRRKTNPRGKVKTKVKYRKVTVADVAVTMRKRQYAVAADASRDERLSKDTEKAATIRVKRAERHDDLARMSYGLVADAIAGVYRGAKRIG